MNALIHALLYGSMLWSKKLARSSAWRRSIACSSRSWVFIAALVGVELTALAEAAAADAFVAGTALGSVLGRFCFGCCCCCVFWCDFCCDFCCGCCWEGGCESGCEDDCNRCDGAVAMVGGRCSGDGFGAVVAAYGGASGGTENRFDRAAATGTIDPGDDVVELKAGCIAIVLLGAASWCGGGCCCCCCG